MKVEAEGHLTLGVLVAEKIEFKRSVVRIQATAMGHTAGSVTVMDKVVAIDPATATLNIALASIVDNTTRVQVRGYIDKTGAIVGVRLDSVGGGGDFLQAPVTAKNATARTLVLYERRDCRHRGPERRFGEQLPERKSWARRLYGLLRRGHTGIGCRCGNAG